MANFGNLQFDEKLFDLEEANIYGIYEPFGYMTWHIEMFPKGEDNYIMLNALVFDGITSPRQLSETTLNETSNTSDLNEHTVRVDGEDRFLKSIDMNFGKWDAENQTIQLTGHGIIDADDNFPAVKYILNCRLRFQGINIFETTKEEVQAFVDTYDQDKKAEIEVKFEHVASGLRATISGNF